MISLYSSTMQAFSMTNYKPRKLGQTEVVFWFMIAQLWRILCDMFLMFFLDNFKSDCILQTLFLSKSDDVKSVWLAFENYVTV